MPQIPLEAPSTWPQSLIHALEHQQSLVDQLKPLAEQQGKLIETGKTDALLGLLGRRQQIIDELTGSQAAMGEHTRDLEQRLADLPSDQCDLIRSLIDHIGECLKDVMNHDEQDRVTLESSRDSLKREISDVNTARQARTAYLGAKAVNNRFADQKG